MDQSIAQPQVQFCDMCGIVLDNLITGIILLQRINEHPHGGRHIKQATVCQKCSPIYRTMGWQEIGRARQV